MRMFTVLSATHELQTSASTSKLLIGRSARRTMTSQITSRNHVRTERTRTHAEVLTNLPHHPPARRAVTQRALILQNLKDISRRRRRRDLHLTKPLQAAHKQPLLPRRLHLDNASPSRRNGFDGRGERGHRRSHILIHRRPHRRPVAVDARPARVGRSGRPCPLQTRSSPVPNGHGRRWRLRQGRRRIGMPPAGARRTAT